MKLPFLQFFPADYQRDTRPLSLATKGGWTDIMCALHGAQNRGTMTLPMIGWARVMGASVDQADAVIAELESMRVADVRRDGNGDVTVTSRRMMREDITREQTRLRVQRHRQNAACNGIGNGSVTRKKSEYRSQKTETKNTKSKAPGGADAPLIVPLVLNVQEFLGPWAQWQAIRRKGKAPKTSWDSYFEKQLAWLEQFGLEAAVEIVAISARNEWQGLFPLKNGAIPRSGTNRHQRPAPSAADHIRDGFK